MMREILISIQPKWCELIANGKKTIEVRKTRPKCDVPFKVYIYCTQGDALAYPCLNNPKFAIHKMATSHSLHGRKLTKKEREESDHTFANGKVIGEFVCVGIDDIECSSYDHKFYSENGSCLSVDEFIRYCNGKDLYGWRISDLVIYDKPKELSDFRKYVPFFDGISTEELEAEGVSGLRIKRPPQSWCYVEGAKLNER